MNEPKNKDRNEHKNARKTDRQQSKPKQQPRSGASTYRKSSDSSKTPYAKSSAKSVGSKPEKPEFKHSDRAAAAKPAYAKGGKPAGKEHPRPRHASPRDNAEELQVGDRIVVTIKRLGINGEGVGYYRRKAVFIDGALTDEVIKAEVSEVQPKFIKAQLKEVEKRSPQRIEPPCPVFGICGGCQIQHISYEGQLQAKTDIVREAFSRYTGLDNVKMKPILGMEHPWDYRNKAQLQVERRSGEIIAGLYEADSHSIVDISGCPIQHPKVNETIEKVKSVLEELSIPLQKEDGQKDGIRTIIVRHGFQSDQLQVTLVSTTSKLPRQDDLIRLLRLSIEGLAGIALNVNPKKTSLIFGDRTITLWGAETMQESLSDLEFSLSPRAFFQLNPQQTVKLYESVRAAASLTGSETVIDAYCGTGTIGLWLAPYAKEVRGIETIAEAVEDAKQNAERNGRTNASFYAGEAEDLLPRWVKGGLRPDVIIADPPRTGLDRRFLDTVLRTKPERFVYVSCNPSTLAKDCKVLLDGGYEIKWAQPVDMFPQTSHVECVVLLQLRRTND
ncbi:23S rRNA (uracil(1939)-C(5))-methyltransferase RlmD [Paenibacillus sp. JX-17]|uniref:23S rRNA (Uracil(1939)-C(5))-methyltransferase RlmD n=1 Tax=Paenibacillus lacisoli TaxID=3064525 RepID=A0ABT9CE22_9BACL|nr:23S rRNA (uracil(1939)-C(5))-methyltransferase RlmD [Paenibacillus sp. JX-17]MDO7907519.1 23S rRNA (uracil(1939)-C(5))-methyltransferase RlmD [Paenibacillus sp. JX-17]